MSKINILRISNFLGIDEMELKAAKINIFKGLNGLGKTSVIEALEKTFTNKNRRTEVVKHGKEEATLYVELDDGLSVDRKIRTSKSNYLKVRHELGGVPSTEAFLSNLVNGNIFRPLDWVNLSVKEQTKSLLSMLEINWDKDDIKNWFGELPSNVNFEQHILLILKSIEKKYYDDREEINREVKELKARIKSIVDDLPPEYNGEEWKEKNVQEYYKKVSEAQNINKLIEQAKALQEGFNDKVNSIKSVAETKKSSISLKYNSEREDIKDIIGLSNSKIEKAETWLSSLNERIDVEMNALDNELNAAIQNLKDKYNKKKDLKKKDMLLQGEEQRDIISIQKEKIAAKEQELAGLSEKEELEKESVDKETAAEIEKVKATLGNASKYLDEHKEIDIEPLQAEADKVQEMTSYLRDWDRISEIRDNQLAQKEEQSAILTQRINKARNLPSELLKTAKMPIEGISVDVEGRVRINGTLIDGLSDGEKLELAMKVAKAQCGDLKLICMDKWESLDKQAQEKLLEIMKNDEYQYFVTEVADNKKIEVEKIGEIE